jgi:hypothetical protein
MKQILYAPFTTYLTITLIYMLALNLVYSVLNNAMHIMNCPALATLFQLE